MFVRVLHKDEVRKALQAINFTWNERKLLKPRRILLALEAKGEPTREEARCNDKIIYGLKSLGTPEQLLGFDNGRREQ